MRLVLSFLALFVGLSLCQAQFDSKIKFPSQDAPADKNSVQFIPMLDHKQDRINGVEVDFDQLKKNNGALNAISKKPKVVERNDWNMPAWIKGQAKELNGKNKLAIKDKAIIYLNEISVLFGESGNEQQFKVVQINKEEKLNMQHVKVQQLFQDIPVFGGEAILHERNGVIESLNGRLFPQPNNIARPMISESIVETIVKKLYADQWKDIKPNMPGIHDDQLLIELMWYPDETTKTLRLAFQANVQPDYIKSYMVWIDAETGVVIDNFKNMCHFHGEIHIETCDEKTHKHIEKPIKKLMQMGSETAVAMDLFGINRDFSVYEQSGTRFMIDSDRAMFNASASTMPNSPHGVIWTLNALGNSPSLNNFTYDHFTSGNNTWSDRASVSAHYNAGVAFEYFENTFNRNSINGNGGNIISFVHVTDEDENDMDNAFWTGKALFYGDGNTAFQPLAKALDVAGHEMSHGVVQNTADLVYRSEPGALNESFADIFGVMIDRDDWTLGEDIVTSLFPSGALRDMANPHNGGSQLGDRGYQPDHYSERYTGQEDNGGVHINSGIPNKAFFLFATSIGKNKAEQVYYRALSNYLTKSSSFHDCRAAIIQSALDLYSETEADAARNAWAAVGVGSGGGSGGGNDVNKPSDLVANPGSDGILVLSVATDQPVLLDGLGDVILNPIANETVTSKPSISDDGSIIVFVNGNNNLYAIEIDWTTGTIIQNEEISTGGGFRNVIISKDGTHLAYTTSTPLENVITVIDLVNQISKDFTLTNPTTGGVTTGNVEYSDAMEFDYSGEFIMYDAFNRISGGASSGDIEYWDIGFIKVWDRDNDDFTDGSIIDKLFNGLDEGESIGNPTFAKTNTGIIAFDYIETDFFGSNYKLLAYNIETTDLKTVFDNSVISSPNYSKNDDRLIFNAKANDDSEILAQIGMASDRISPEGDATIFVNGAYNATWFANGDRNIHVGVENEELQSAWEISPNPTSGAVNINWTKEIGNTKSISVYNMLGQQLMYEKMTFEINTEKSFDLSNFESGVLLFKLETDKGYSKKIIIKQ